MAVFLNLSASVSKAGSAEVAVLMVAQSVIIKSDPKLARPKLREQKQLPCSCVQHL